VVCYTQVDENIDKMIEVDEYCRKHGIGFIMTQTHGPSGYAFVDYGQDFVVTDADGEETKSFIVVNVTQTDPCIVTVHEDKRHKFQDGDYVKFTEVQGMTELNTLEPTKITVIDGYSFKVHVDATKFKAYTRQGIVQNVKVPQKIQF
jgi:ubiquitin-activating enzyme E1